MTEDVDEQPLLPTLRDDPVLAQSLRDSLRILRDQAAEQGDDDVRRRIDAVLEGRESLRTLARDGTFSAFVEPLAARGWQRWDELSEEERERLTAEADRRGPGPR